MQNIYVFDSNYKIPLQVIQSSLNNLQSIMYNVNDEEQEFLHSDSFKRIMQEFIPEKQSSISKKTGKFDYDDD